MWKTRTRTKIMSFALIQLDLWLNIAIYAWFVQKRTDAPTMILALLGAGTLSFMTFLYTIMKENGGIKKDG